MFIPSPLLIPKLKTMRFNASMMKHLLTVGGGGRGSTTAVLVRTVAATADDRGDDAGVWNPVNRAWIECGAAVLTSQGMRFSNVTIPQGATINSAILSCMVYLGAGFNDFIFNAYCEAIDNSPDYVDINQKPSLRARTAAFAVHNDLAVPLGWYNSPEYNLMIQEVISRPGWVSGNALSILWITPVPWAAYGAARSFDSGVNIEFLTINYTF